MSVTVMQSNPYQYRQAAELSLLNLETRSLLLYCKEVVVLIAALSTRHCFLETANRERCAAFFLKSLQQTGVEGKTTTVCG